jgi:hypothetical protein
LVISGKDYAEGLGMDFGDESDKPLYETLGIHELLKAKDDLNTGMMVKPFLSTGIGTRS